MGFCTKYPDCVNYTVNIFMFPELLLSAGSETTVVMRRWGKSPDSNILTLYTDAVYPMKQRCVTPILGW